MQAGLTAKIAAANVDPVAQQKPPVVARRIARRTLVFILIGILAYVIGLIATIPAATMIDESDRVQVGGTIWRGEAVLASTIRFEWVFSPLTTLSKMAFSAEWRVSGGGTDLAGTATKRGNQLQFVDVAGQADGSLLDAAFPDLPLSCRFTADVRVDQAYLGGEGQRVQGTLRTGPMACSAKQLAALPVELPAMTGALGPGGNGTAGALISSADQAHILELRLSPQGMLSVWPTQFAVQRVPFLAGKRYDTQIE